MTKTAIAIIGAAGERGAAIVKTLAKGNYSLLLMEEDGEALQRLTASLRREKVTVSVISCAKDACWEADTVILAVPHEEEVQAAKYVKDVVTQKLVIRFAAKGTGHCQEELEKLLPYSKVVQAVVDENNRCLLSGSSEEAVKEAAELLEPVFEVVRR